MQFRPRRAPESPDGGTPRLRGLWWQTVVTPDKQIAQASPVEADVFRDQVEAIDLRPMTGLNIISPFLQLW